MIDTANGGDHGRQNPTWVIVHIPATEPVRKGPFWTEGDIKDHLYGLYHERGDAFCLVLSGTMSDPKIVEAKAWLAWDGQVPEAV